MTMNTKTIMAAALAAVCAFAVGCGPGGETDAQAPAAGDDGILRIAVIPKGTSNVYWQTVHAGARKAEKEIEGIEILWKGPTVETNRNQQIAIIDDFVVQGVDGIALAPQDAEALAPVVDRVAMAGIPLVIMDSGVNTDQFVSFVATDNYLGGVKAAQEMSRQLGGEGKVAIIGNDPGGQSTNEREQGFQDELKDNHAGIEVAGFQYHYNDRGKARAIMEDFLTRHSDLDGVFCSNESSSIGALLALQASGRSGGIDFIGFDSSDDLVKALEEGTMHAIIQQDPFKIGYESVAVMAAHLRGADVGKRVDTGVYVITRGNMKEPEMIELLHPDLDVLGAE